jgi:hypothetical protein
VRSIPIRGLDTKTYRLRLASGQVVTVEHRVHPTIPPSQKFVACDNGFIMRRQDAEACGFSYNEGKP